MNELLTEMKRTSVGEPKQDRNANATSIQILNSSSTLPDELLHHSLNGGGFNCSDTKIDLQVNFASEENASMVYTALSVDRELQPDKVKRDMVLSGCQLFVHFSAVEARFLRASFSAFMDILVLATRTIEQFGSN